MTENEFQKLYERLLDVFYVEGVIQNCTLCAHWNPSNPIGKDGKAISTANDTRFPPETCRKYSMRPPAKVIVKGCPSFCRDEIPF